MVVGMGVELGMGSGLGGGLCTGIGKGMDTGVAMRGLWGTTLPPRCLEILAPSLSSTKRKEYRSRCHWRLKPAT